MRCSSEWPPSTTKREGCSCSRSDSQGWCSQTNANTGLNTAINSWTSSWNYWTKIEKPDLEAHQMTSKTLSTIHSSRISTKMPCWQRHSHRPYKWVEVRTNMVSILGASMWKTSNQTCRRRSSLKPKSIVWKRIATLLTISIDKVLTCQNQGACQVNSRSFELRDGWSSARVAHDTKRCCFKENSWIEYVTKEFGTAGMAEWG